ncbi:protein PHOSPHATE STARVATION RESPONSE 1-like [Camellia sinensis]|uniref:protein PHOSPHATE STARVATION RESPONSE 1-like n=1 Tax=Camellia sinensis TaxID=4442 RepID=UPI0010369622|nr:protein PHOSPHATE STARVATION RESPONSE 1-like [Camellia sinensis]
MTEELVSGIIFQGALSSALPVLPSTLEEKYPKLPNAQQVFMERELDTNSPSLYSSFLSNSRVVGPMFSSTSGYFNDLYLSSIAPPEKHSRKSPFSTNAGASMPLAPCHSTMLQSVASSKSYSLSTDSLADFFDYPVNTSSRKIQIGSSMNGGCAMATEDLSKQNDWQDWVDLINDDDSLNSDLNEIFVDNIVEDPELKVTNYSEQQSKVLQQISAPSEDSPHALNSTSTASGGPTKMCMCWTPEAFAEAVNKLGGSERSSEKKFTRIEEVASLDLKTGIELTEAIRLQMGVQKPLHEQSEIQRNNLQLRIEEQGRHLLIMFEKQCKASSSEKKFTCIEEVASLDLKTGIELTEAIRLQMGVQKPLHEQLEIQRNNLQLRIEEQGRHLLIMFEKQCKASDTLKASSIVVVCPHPGKLLC